MAIARFSKQGVLAAVLVGTAAGGAGIGAYRWHIATAFSAPSQIRQLRAILTPVEFESRLGNLLDGTPAAWSLGAKLLCDRDRTLAAQADRLLLREFGRLDQHQPVDLAGLAAFLRSLKTQLDAPGLPAEAHETAARWAVRILDHLGRDGILTDVGALRRGELLAACEAVLEATESPLSTVHTQTGRLTQSDRTTSSPVTSTSPDSPKRPVLAVPGKPLRHVPGGGLHFESVEREQPRSSTPVTSTTTNAIKPASATTATEPTPQSVMPIAAQPIAENQPAALLEGAMPGPRPIPKPIDLATLAPRELMALLHDDTQRELALRELTRRGFSPRDLNIAAELVHPDVEVRRRLAQDLPRALGSQAEGWLVLLLEDPDVDVRLAASSWLATSIDARVISEVLARARREQDPRFQRLAQKLGQRQ